MFRSLADPGTDAFPPAPLLLGTSADLNGDGVDELLTEFQVWSLDTAGVFQPSPTAGLLGEAAAIEDLDGDGDLDVMAVFGESAQACMQQPALTFTCTSQYETGGPTQVLHLALGDLDGDGRRDLVVTPTREWGYEATVLRRQANGSFGSPATYQLAQDQLYVLADDATGDGRVDLISSRGDGNLRVHANFCVE